MTDDTNSPAPLLPAATVPVTPEERVALSMLRAACIDASGELHSPYLGAMSTELMALSRGDLANAAEKLNDYALREAFAGHAFAAKTT